MSIPADIQYDIDHETPNHIIIWADQHIGIPDQCTRLKKAFGSNTDPRAETWTMLNDKDYDKMLAVGQAVSVRFEGVVFLLQAFTNEDACLKAFEEHNDKRIFLITSGTLGKKIMPKIATQYRHKLIDPIQDKPYSNVYIFCGDIAAQLGWALDYLEYIQTFDFENDLLERLTRDISEYFIERSQRLKNGEDLKGALRFLHWAKILRHQYDKMIQNIATDDGRAPPETEEMREINRMIEKIEQLLPRESSEDETHANDDEDDDPVAQDCS